MYKGGSELVCFCLLLKWDWSSSKWLSKLLLW